MVQMLQNYQQSVNNAVPAISTETNFMTRLLEQQANSQNNQLVIYIFKFTAQENSTCKPKYNVIAFDFIETRTGSSVWNHKPNQWEMLFQCDKLATKSQGGQYLNAFFHNFKACPQRDNPLSNETKQRTTKNKKVVQAWLLYQLIDHSMTENDIKSNMMLLSEMADDIEIKKRYHTLISNQGFTGELVSQTHYDTGNFWKKLQNAAKYNIAIVRHNTLCSIFKDEDIKTIVKEMFGINTPVHLWPQEVKNFAFQST